jgi:lysophospholipase L1-like esterase
VYDIHAPRGEDWPRLLERRLRASGWPEVEVINAGVPGHASWDNLGRFYSEIWLFQPDIVMVSVAWNDIKDFRWVGPDSTLLRGQRPIYERWGDSWLVDNPFLYERGFLDRLALHSQLYVRLRGRFLNMRLGQRMLEGQRVGSSMALADSISVWAPRQYEMNLRLLAEAAKAAGATPVLLTEPRLAASSTVEADRRRIRYDWVGLSHAALLSAFAAVDSAIVRAADRTGAVAVDLAAHVGHDGALFADHVHTTPAGSARVADALASDLTPLLRRMRRR